MPLLAQYSPSAAELAVAHFLNGLCKYDQLWISGRAGFQPTVYLMTDDSLPTCQSQPEWLLRLTENVCAAIVEQPEAAAIGCHHFFDEQRVVWELTVFFGRLEIVGGAHDGETFNAGFSLDVTSLAAEFDYPPEIRWCGAAQGRTDDLGAHLSLEGLWHGRRVWLRFLSQAPAHLGPGSQLLATTGEFRPLW